MAYIPVGEFVEAPAIRFPLPPRGTMGRMIDAILFPYVYCTFAIVGGAGCLHLALRQGPWPDWTKPTWPAYTPQQLAERERWGRVLCAINGTIFSIVGVVGLGWNLAMLVVNGFSIP
jgi:hypothetical protein